MNHVHDGGVVRPLGFNLSTRNPALQLLVPAKRHHKLLPELKLSLLFILACLFTATPGFASPECGVTTDNSAASKNTSNTEKSTLSVLANDFPALHAVTQSMQECSPPELTITAEHTKEYRQLQLPALESDPAAFDVVMTGNNAIVPLLNDGLLQPLDDAIERIAPQLPDNLKIRFGGKTYAVALLANSQHLFVREDLLQKAGLEIPRSYVEILEVCAVLQKAGWQQKNPCN